MTNPDRAAFELWFAKQFMAQIAAEWICIESVQRGAELAAQAVEQVAMAIGVHCPCCDGKDCPRDMSEIPWRAAMDIAGVSGCREADVAAAAGNQPSVLSGGTTGSPSEPAQAAEPPQIEYCPKCGTALGILGVDSSAVPAAEPPQPDLKLVMLRDKVKRYGGKADIVVLGDESILVLERYGIEGALAAARLDAARKMLAECVAWIGAENRDCGCTERILANLPSGDEQVARIVAPKEGE